MMAFSNRLKKARFVKNLPQSQAALAVGCPLRTLQEWEQGRAEPPAWCQSLVLKALGHRAKVVDLPA